MLQIDRMEIDDAGGNPANLAHSILKQIGDLRPPVPVREIAEAIDIYEIKEEPLEGLEGALVTRSDKSDGAILVNIDRPTVRKRYTIGHELGHYVNPWHRASSPEGFRCTSRDLALERHSPSDRATKMEIEANLFAAELLMPITLVRSFVRNYAGVDMNHILGFANSFEVSREAAARRYIANTDEPSAIVFSKAGIIRYAKLHEDFPRLDVWNRDPLPLGSLSRECELPIGKVSDWAEVDGGVWLQRANGRQVCEQTLAQRNEYRMTLLTLDEIEPEDEWETPRIHR